MTIIIKIIHATNITQLLQELLLISLVLGNTKTFGLIINLPSVFNISRIKMSIVNLIQIMCISTILII